MSLLSFLGKLYFTALLAALFGQSLQQDSEFVNLSGAPSDLSPLGENKLEDTKPPEKVDRLRLLSGALAENVNLRQKVDDHDEILSDETNNKTHFGVRQRTQR